MELWFPQPFFVDKSKVVKRFVRNRHKIIMISAPQGFLKSSNMRLMATFLDGTGGPAAAERRRTFWTETGLRIMKEADVVDEYFGRWPCVYVSFAAQRSSGAGGITTVDAMAAVVRDLYERHKALLASDRLSPGQKFTLETYRHFSCGGSQQQQQPQQQQPPPPERRGAAGERKLADAVALLCDILRAEHRKPVYVFVDDYDAPLLRALAEGRPLANAQPLLAKMVRSLHESRAVKKVLLNGAASYAAAAGAGAVAAAGAGDDDEDGGGRLVKVYPFLRDHEFTEYYAFVEEDVQRLTKASRCSREISGQIAGQHYVTAAAGRKLYSPEWLLDFLKLNISENAVWFADLLRKPVMTTVGVRRKMAPLERGAAVKARVLTASSRAELLQLNRLLNGDVGDVEDDEAELLLKLLFDLGMFSPVQPANDSFSLASCHCKAQHSLKLRIAHTSRMAKLRPSAVPLP